MLLKKGIAAPLTIPEKFNLHSLDYHDSGGHLTCFTTKQDVVDVAIKQLFFLCDVSTVPTTHIYYGGYTMKLRLERIVVHDIHEVACIDALCQIYNETPVQFVCFVSNKLICCSSSNLLLIQKQNTIQNYFLTCKLWFSLVFGFWRKNEVAKFVFANLVYGHLESTQLELILCQNVTTLLMISVDQQNITFSEFLPYPIIVFTCEVLGTVHQLFF